VWEDWYAESRVFFPNAIYGSKLYLTSRLSNAISCQRRINTPHQASLSVGTYLSDVCSYGTVFRTLLAFCDITVATSNTVT